MRPMSARVLSCVVALAACGDNRVIVDPCLFVRCVGERCLDGERLAPGDARRIAVGTTRLYAFDVLGTLFELPNGATEFRQVFETGAFLSAVRNQGDRIAWASNFGADMYEPSELMGATPIRTLTDDAITFGFAMDDQAIYYGQQNNVLVRVTLEDQMPRAWAATQATALGVTLAGDDLYFTNCESVFRARNEVLGVQEPIARGGCAIEIVSNARNVAWTEESLTGANSVIRRYDIATGIVTDLVETLPGEVVLHVDDTHVYYGTGGALCRIPVDGGVPAKVAVGIGFALTATEVYWSFNREVFRAPKPSD